MSSRPRVRIPPAQSERPRRPGRAALPLRGRSSVAQSTGLSGQRSPVRARSSPSIHGGCGVSGSIRDCESRRCRFDPDRPPFNADAEHGRAPRAVNAVPPAVVVRLHPSAPSRGTKLWWQSVSLATRRRRFDSCRLHRASVVSTASTRPLYGRGLGSIPSGGLARVRGVTGA
jgi:hypothetical protein